MKTSQMYFLVIVFLFLHLKGFGQVGVNTSNPQGMFHIDGAKDNPNIGLPNITQQTNDIVITAVGNMGLGTISPTAKLDIETGGTPAVPIAGLKLVDGTQRNNLVLTSDDNGLAKWQPIAIPFYTKTFTGSFTLPANTGTGLGIGSVRYTGQYLDLPPGKWAINLIFGMSFPSQASYTQGTNFVRFRLEDSTGNYDANVIPGNVSADAILPKLASAGFTYSMDKGTLNGILAINNQSNGTKRYYIHMDNAASTGGIQPGITVQFSWNETSLIYYEIK